MPRPEGTQQAKQDLYQILSSLSTAKFLKLCRKVDMDDDFLEEHKMRGDFPDEMKRDHILRSFHRDKQEFVMKHLEKLPLHYGQFADGTSEAASIPNLDERTIYKLMDSFKEQHNWTRIAYEEFGVKISLEEHRCAPRELCEEQKRTMISQWINEQASKEEAHETLERQYQVLMQQNRAF